MGKIGQNDKCPCGSGKKYKKCCANPFTSVRVPPTGPGDFLTASVDLAGTIFSPTDLFVARLYLRELLRSRCPDWLAKPKGDLSLRWNYPIPFNVCYCIEVARMGQRLDRGLDPVSRNIAAAKLAKLFELKADDYEAHLSELQAIDLLVQLRLPIHVEPALRRASGECGRPDVCIHIDGKNVFSDATRFRYSVLHDWEKAAVISVNMIGDRLGGTDNGGKVVQLTLPLACRYLPLTREEAGGAAKQVISDAFGHLGIPRPEGSIDIDWHSVPVVPRNQPTHAVIYTSHPLAFGGEHTKFIAHGTDLSVGTASSWPRKDYPGVTAVTTGVSAIVTLQLPEIEAGELLLKAITHRFDDKLAQIKTSEPLLLIMSIAGRQEVITPAVLRLVAARMWPNPKFRRMSGFSLFWPRTTFGASDRPSPSLLTLLNPNAEHPVGPELSRVLGVMR
jgi:hypothetical protein